MNMIARAVSDLKKLKRLSKKGRRKFFKECSKDCVLRICECIKNILKGNVPLKSCHLKKLSRHRQSLRSLSAKSTTLVKRRKLLQKGGFLGALLPAILPALIDIFMPQNNAAR